MNTPVGKGMFIWQMRNTCGGDPAAIVAAARTAGLQWLTVKVHDGTAPIIDGDLAGLSMACFKAGLALYGWGYNYGVNIPGEAAIAARRCNELGLAGYFIDAEGEYKLVSPNNALRFVNSLRQALTVQVIGLCSFRYPQSHPELPWAALLAGCDFHAPQVYPLGVTSPIGFGLQLTRSVAQLKALRDLPVIPIGPAFAWTDPTGKPWEPTIAQLDDFDHTAHATALPGVGWWSWEAAWGRTEWWSAISRHDWAPAPVPPAPSPHNLVADHLSGMVADLDEHGTVTPYNPIQ